MTGTENPPEPGITAPNLLQHFGPTDPYHKNNFSFFKRDVSWCNRCHNIGKVDQIQFQQARACPCLRSTGLCSSCQPKGAQTGFPATPCCSAKPWLKRTQTSITHNIQIIIQPFHQGPNCGGPPQFHFLPLHISFPGSLHPPLTSF